MLEVAINNIQRINWFRQDSKALVLSLSLLLVALCYSYSLYMLYSIVNWGSNLKAKKFPGIETKTVSAHTREKKSSLIFHPCTDAEVNDIEIFQATLGIYQLMHFQGEVFCDFFCCHFIPNYFNLRHVFAFRFGHSCNLNAIVR